MRNVLFNMFPIKDICIDEVTWAHFLVKTSINEKNLCLLNVDSLVMTLTLLIDVKHMLAIDISTSTYKE